MTDFDNKLNLNNVHNTYAPAKKKQEKAPACEQEECREPVTTDGSKAAESYGRALVKQAEKADNIEMTQGVKDAMDFFINNPELAAAAVRSSDDAHELLEAQGTEHAYEKACCGACDAAYDRV